MRTNPKAFLALLGILSLGACGGDASTGVNGDASGTYILQLINGNQLPYTVATGATTTLTFQAGTLTIGTDNTFSETLDLDEFDSATGATTSTTSTCVGTYSQRGNGFTFSESSSTDPNCGFTYGGAWNGSNAFTVTFAPGAAAYYTK